MFWLAREKCRTRLIDDSTSSIMSFFKNLDHKKVHSANQFGCDMTSGTRHDRNGKYFLDDVRVGKTKKVAPIFTDKIKSFETVNVRVGLMTLIYIYPISERNQIHQL